MAKLLLLVINLMFLVHLLSFNFFFIANHFNNK